MKSGITGMVLIALFTNVLCYAQNDTPMEVLVNIAHESERFIPYNMFQNDDRESAYLDSYLSKYSLLKLNIDALGQLVTEGSENISISLPSPDGNIIDVKLINHDIRAEGFSITDKLTSKEYEIPDAQFYRGILSRGNDSQAGLSFFRDEVYGLFSSLEMGNIILAKDPILEGDGSNYILYFENDLLIERDTECGTDYFAPYKTDPGITSRENVYSSCKDIEIYVEATKKLYDARGSIASVSNFISAFFNNVSILYRNESMYTSLKRVTVNTTEDGYSSLGNAFDKLNKFGEENKNKYQQYGAELAHLVDVSPGLGGIAWINALCVNYKYYTAQDYHYGAYAYSSVLNEYSNFPDYSLTVFMFTHEMGHNLGSQHTQWCSWPGGAIDNCTSTEGGCSPGPAPTNGGTIMSYCHNASYGINYSNGFGPLPGNKIRTLSQSKTCIEEYVPSKIVLTSPNQTTTANRECTDKNGWTNYYFDNNTSSETDDKLLLSIKKENEDIGNLDDGTLIVQVFNSSNAGNGSTHIDNPGYQSGNDWHVMNRWFDLVPTKQPLNPVTVRFPYTTDDFTDVIMNQPAVSGHDDLIFYKINSPGNPDPDLGHEQVTDNQVTFYTSSSAASLDTWKYTSKSSAHFAEFMVNSFSGGGGGFSPQFQSSVPVVLMKFEARKIDDYAALEWETASEVNNDFFTIEQSFNGIDFEEIGKVKSEGNAVNIEKYSFLARNLENGLNYFRLSQTDFDGTFVYLGVRAIEYFGDRKFTLFPNPVTTDILNINYNLTTESQLSISIMDIGGRLIVDKNLKVSEGNDNIPIHLENFKAGIYLVQIVGEDFSYTHKLIKD